MTKLRYFDGSLGFWATAPLGSYRIVNQTAQRWVLENRNEDGPASYEAHRVIFTISGGETYTNEQQEQTFFTAGQITGITWFNADGEKLAQATGLSVDAVNASVLFNWTSDNESPRHFWNFVLHHDTEGSVITGSDETGEAGLPWGDQLDQMDLGDDIETTTGNDTVRAGRGNDYISDFGGTDIYDGQEGDHDIVSYLTLRRHNLIDQTGIRADLQAGKVTGPDGLVDTLISIEAIGGTNYADILRGSSADNTLLGRAGNDTLDGRAGFDTAWYAYDTSRGIAVDMARGIVLDGFGGRDKLTSIESVVGTRLNDTFKDTRGAQLFEGREGRDHFTLGLGTDTVTGGIDQDVFKFVGRNFGTDTITDFTIGDDLIHITALRRFSGVSAQDEGDDLVISIGNSRIILQGLAGETLQSENFIFG